MEEKYSLSVAYELVHNHRHELPGNEPERDKYLLWLKSQIVRTEEDKKQAVLLARDASKTLLGFGASVIFAAFVACRFAVLGAWGKPSLFLIVSAGFLAGYTLVQGMTLQSTVYKAAAGIEGYEDRPAWDLERLRPFLGKQAMAGLASFIALAIGLLLAEASLP